MDGTTQPLSPDQPISPGTPEIPDLDIDPQQFNDEDTRRRPNASPREEPPD
ncbi:hypothetical protein [Amycolatopsis coloradensis]|uniref:hypothetical protein n=1 Tax=Amycolatopsis coloradensis TaxID=76021 RepID=UPI00130196B4|nr:hypothetical protein [Amycolatopsis coloradensis]